MVQQIVKIIKEQMRQRSAKLRLSLKRWSVRSSGKPSHKGSFRYAARSFHLHPEKTFAHTVKAKHRRLVAFVRSLLFITSNFTACEDMNVMLKLMPVRITRQTGSRDLMASFLNALQGTVRSFDKANKFYRVVYEDDDSEDLSPRELNALLSASRHDVNGQQEPAKGSKKRCAPNVTNADPQPVEGEPQGPSRRNLRGKGRTKVRQSQQMRKCQLSRITKNVSKQICIRGKPWQVPPGRPGKCLLYFKEMISLVGFEAPLDASS